MFVHFEKIIDKLDMELYRASVPLRLHLGNCPHWAIIRSPCNLKIFFAGIPQGPLETSPGTIGITQKRFQGPPARGF